MDTYRYIFAHWSIFTLPIQLIYCASVYSNIDSMQKSTALITYSESLCNQQTERFIQSDGKNSSLTLELNPGRMMYGSCKRVLIAPESHGFFVRLSRPKEKKTQSMNPSMKNIRRMSPKMRNSSRSCPLSIFSTNDPLTAPWRIDPCQLESRSEFEEPVRLLQGHLRIIWDHGGNTPVYKLIVTVLGKGLPCQKTNKHPCLSFGSETLLCISNDLICDGIRNCPSGKEYNSDEDFEMCAKQRKESGRDGDIWHHITKEIFRNLFSTEPTSSSSKDIIPISQWTTEAVSNRTEKKDFEVEVRRNVTRGSLTGDLSRYGPWGYLMLGMLLCGGALLICGLWECCCRQNKPANESVTNSPDTSGTGADANTQGAMQSAPDPLPPNYDDLDPPPPYSILFPNQKVLTNPIENTHPEQDSSPSPELAQTTSS